MQLKALQIQGFKSFPEKTTLNFDQGITAVVGPNGSGKSNISDAMSWVMGEQSVRSLRGEKMEDVIFLGSDKRKPTGYAFVSLSFDNKDRALNVDSDEVTISRKLYRSGESEYRINAAAVRLKDINELLMDTGLGRDGYSIIGQGRIDEIVSAKSSQRREIFEEAAGISKFRYRKEEAEKKLQAAYDNLLRLKDIMAELEERVEPLRIQSEKAQKFLVLSEEKKGLEVSLWIDSLDKLSVKLEQQEALAIVAKNKLSDTEAVLE
ncbi:MAG: AAA family ATPase [Oscillospiraceae bacterium]|nr:AAA family ATPase [Oscillospiraceae bacterium]